MLPSDRSRQYDTPDFLDRPGLSPAHNNIRAIDNAFHESRIRFVFADPICWNPSAWPDGNTSSATIGANGATMDPLNVFAGPCG